jgi:hypothetical protein
MVLWMLLADVPHQFSPQVGDGGEDDACDELSDEETAALTQELHEIVENDRYPFSPRIRTLSAILAKLRPGRFANPCRRRLSLCQGGQPMTMYRFQRSGDRLPIAEIFLLR